MVPASYLLFDSWFAFPAVARKIREQKLHVICMLKSMPKVYYDYQGQKLNLNKLYGAVRKKRGRAKILASIIVGIGQLEDGEQVSAKIVFELADADNYGSGTEKPRRNGWRFLPQIPTCRMKR